MKISPELLERLLSNDIDPDEITFELEKLGYGWDVGDTGRMIECRIWEWPYVVGRFRPDHRMSIRLMLQGAINTISEGQRY